MDFFKDIKKRLIFNRIFNFKYSIFFVLLFALCSLLFVIPVLAQPPDLNLGLEYAKATGLVDTDIRIIIARIINVALGLLGIVALGFTLYGGYEYMTAGGNEEQIAKAKKILINAAIGLAIMLSAFAITRFVISKLTDAIVGTYCVDHPADCQPATPPCGPGECQPPVQTLFYATSTPSGQLPIKNITVSVLFFGNFGFPANYQAATVPPDAPGNIKIIKKSDPEQNQVPGVFQPVFSGLPVSSSRIDFTPNGSCLDPAHPDDPSYSDSSNTCFATSTTYQVILTTNIKSTNGLSLDCSTVHPCVGEFTTGDKFDKEPPNISLILPGDGARLSVNTNIEISANYSDDAGVKMVTFNRDESKIKDIVLNPFERQGTTSTPWFTGITAPATYALTAVAADIDNHETTSTAQTVQVLPAHCFDGSQNFDETGLDCGGVCGACLGEACESNLDCAGTYCDPVTKTCVARPVIIEVNPMNGKEGNYISIFGRYFGGYSAVSSTVRFLGDETDPADDKTAASVTCFGGPSWADNLIVVAVPTWAVSGPLQVGIDGLANLNNVLKQDKTNDDWGPNFPTSTLFIVNDTARPGLCGAQPSEQAPKQYVEVAGTNLGSSGVLKFGNSSATVGTWANALLSNVEVPADLPAQNLTVQAEVIGKKSNPIPFKVLPPTIFTGPHIDYLEPTSGPAGSYLTIFGQNFGSLVGRVAFTKDEETKYGVQPPDDCSNSWTLTQIIIKVPSGFSAGQATVRVEANQGDGSSKASDNSKLFEITSGAAPPGLCLIEPNNGPAGTTAVILKGEGFGGSGKVEYWEKTTSTFVSTWSDLSITDKVPAGAKTGPVKVWSEIDKLYSNSMNFKVQNCQTDKTVVCAAGTTCCASGSCLALCPEAVGPKSSVYAWSFSTGKLPVVPQVVEQCGNFCTESKAVCNKDVDCKGGSTDKCQLVTPSPAPWSPHWPGHDNVCVNANISLRFNTPINNDGQVLTKDNIKDLIFVYRCPDSACELKDTNQLLLGDYLIGNWQSGNDKIVFAPKIAFPTNDIPPPLDAIATSTSYQVIVTTKVRSDQGNLFANMPANPNCPDISKIKTGRQAAYCFKFRTRAIKDYCELGSIVIDPITYTTSILDHTFVDFYNLTPLASKIDCLGLNASVYNWQWLPKSGESDYAEVSNKDVLPKNKVDGNVDPVQDLKTKDKETPAGQPQLISAYWTADKQSPKITGKAYLYITPQKPKVEEHWPDCTEACINAEIGARFNMALDFWSLPNTAVTGCQIEDAGDSCQVEEVSDLLSLGTTDLEDDTLIIVPAGGDLAPNKYYRVILKGGPYGVKSFNGLEIDKTSLNYNCVGAGDQKVCQDFSWTFKTKDDSNACEIDRVEMRPASSTVYWIGQTSPFWALPFGAPDECSIYGQRLRGVDYNWTWTTQSTAASPPATLNAAVTQLDLAPATPTCSANCLILSAKSPLNFCLREGLTKNCCGNETVDSSGNNEECELGQPGCDGKCQFAGSSYLYTTSSYCGDGAIGIGEACEPPNSAKDGKFEPLQYATAVSPVFAEGRTKFSTEIYSQTTNPKTQVKKRGLADFTMQCGYQPVNSACPDTLPASGLCSAGQPCGVGKNSCCYPRPTVVLIQPAVSTNVCPNTALIIHFDKKMDISTLTPENIILSLASSTGGNPGDNCVKVGPGIAENPVGFWQKILAFFKKLLGRSVSAAGYFCSNGIDYTVSASDAFAGGVEGVDVELKLKNMLRADTTNNIDNDYRIFVVKDRVKTITGVTMPASALNYFDFDVGKDICKIDKIVIDPAARWFRTLKNEADDDPSLTETFDKKDDVDKVFASHAYTTQNIAGASEQELQSMSGYSWIYNWAINDETIVKRDVYRKADDATDSAARILALGKNGLTQVGATAVIDASSVIDTGSQYSASSTVQVFICENPWPAIPVAGINSTFGLGYVDADGNDNGILVGKGWTNFKLMYCRDAGKPNDTSDDLPELNSPTVITHTRSTNGTACTVNSNCTSGFCADGVCCDTACTGSTCQTCGNSSSEGAGTCGYVTSGDPDNECGTTGCLKGNCTGSSYACDYYTSGEHNCTTACTTCTGATSGSCVNTANNIQDTEGSNTCSATCKKCSSGSCVNQSSGENLFSQCSSAYTCSGFKKTYRNMCDGSGACADIDAAANDCVGYCQAYCLGGAVGCSSADTTLSGTCTVSDSKRVVSGGDGHCVSGACVADVWTCGNTVTFTYKGSSVIYGTVSRGSKCWLDRNLGASRVATVYNDADAYGDLFQWGRLADGHQTRTSGKTITLSSSDNPLHSNFIYGMSSPYDWRSPQNNNLWQGVSGRNNPCPSGWRIPTYTEWDNERSSWGSNDSAGAYASSLKLTLTGNRYYSNASLSGMGSYGVYWSSTVSGANAYYLFFTSVNAYMLDNARAYGLSVRCLKDTTTLKANGTACISDSECSSTYCVNNVCCNTACNTQTCERCDSYSNAGVGICGFISTAVDPDSECPGAFGTCASTNCSGTGYSCGYLSGQQTCVACKYCTGSSYSCTNATTNWGSGLYGCSAGASTDPNRCYGGSCINCGGWGNAGYCWYNAGMGGPSCATLCSTKGGAYGGTCDWVNDPTDCSTCKHFYTSASCAAGVTTYQPKYLDANTTCYYHKDGTNDCSTYGNISRQCACEQ